MSTSGHFAAWTERAKDVVVNQLRAHFSLQLAKASTNVLSEQPLIEKYGLAGESPQASFVQINTAFPQTNQRIPHIAIQSSPGTERKMGIGRQVIATFHDTVTGKPMVREVVGGDMNIIIDVSSVDTNERSEITDILYTFFTHYAEEQQFTFLGSAVTDEDTGAQNLYQLIIKAQAQIGGESELARPEGESFDKVYMNRVTVPILFIDYVDREAFDISACFNNTLDPADDVQKAHIDTLPEPKQYTFASSDDFELNVPPSDRWTIWKSPDTRVQRITTPDDLLINGLGSLQIDSISDPPLAALISKTAPGITDGRVRVQFNADLTTAVILFCQLQGADPFASDAYWLLVKPTVGGLTRLQLVKGSIKNGEYEVLNEGSFVKIAPDLSLAAQIEWKIDAKKGWTRVRGWVSSCDCPQYGSLVKRLEYLDKTGLITSVGEGFGLRENPDAPNQPGAVVFDDVEVLREYVVAPCRNPRRVG